METSIIFRNPSIQSRMVVFKFGGWEITFNWLKLWNYVFFTKITKILLETFLIQEKFSEAQRKICILFDLILILIHFDSQFILIFIQFDLRFKLILFILIRFDFDSSRITIHPRIMIHLRIKIKSNQKSKKGESWFTHFRIIGWFVFESKAN